MSLKNNAPAPTRGLISVEIGGQKRTFKFGMNALAEYGVLRPAESIDGLFHDLQTNPLRFFVDMAYCGLLQRADENQLPDRFSPAVVGDWIDDMPQEDWNKVREVMLTAIQPGKPATEASQTPA